MYDRWEPSLLYFEKKKKKKKVLQEEKFFFSEGQVGRDGVVCKVHNCMIPNTKTYFDKRVTFLAMTPVSQQNSHPHFLIYVRSK